jgi:hypothetical protein
VRVWCPWTVSSALPTTSPSPSSVHSRVVVRLNIACERQWPERWRTERVAKTSTTHLIALRLDKHDAEVGDVEAAILARGVGGGGVPKHSRHPVNHNLATKQSARPCVRPCVRP